MDELLKLSIEELEHVLAIAPYSEMHQMAYAIKKNQHDKGSMYQVMEGNYHQLKITQDQIAQQVISNSSKSRDIINQPDVLTSSSTSTSTKKYIDTSEGKSADKVPEKKKPKKKKESTKEQLELIGSEGVNLVGDVSSFILPDKNKEKKKKKKKKVKESVKSKKKTKKKSRKKITKNSEIKNVGTNQSSKSERDLSGLSDFSAWLLEQSKESHIHPLKEKSKKKKKKKHKKKSTKKKKKKNKNLVSEPLADLLVSQGHIEEAVEMYRKLGLIIPEKNAFFAAKIDKIQKDT